MAKDKTANPNEPNKVTTLQTNRQLSTVRFSSCGKYLAGAGRDAAIRLWEVVETEGKDPSFNELPSLAGHDGWATSIAFHPSEPRLFSADSWGQLRASTLAGNTAETAWQVKDAHDGWIRQIAISPDGARLATCGMDKRICLWSTVDGKREQEISDLSDAAYSVCFHPDGKSLVSGDLRGMVSHWDLATTKKTREFDAKIFFMIDRIQEVGGVRTLAFNAAGDTLAACGTQPASGGFVEGVPAIRFFNWESGKETTTLQLGDKTEGFVHDIVYHPKDFWIGVSSGQPGKGKFFLLKPGEAQASFSSALPNCHSIAAHPNGVRFAVISNAGTFGQKRSRAREGDYPGNTSPVNIWNLPQA